jgi:hypothetical protein
MAKPPQFALNHRVLRVGELSSTLNPGQPDYRDVEVWAIRYDYDPRRATRMIQALGYSRGADGSLRGPGGQPLTVEIRTSAGDDLQEKTLFAAADV